jgi:hypothetical protein
MTPRNVTLTSSIDIISKFAKQYQANTVTPVCQKKHQEKKIYT